MRAFIALGSRRVVLYRCWAALVCSSALCRTSAILDKTWSRSAFVDIYPLASIGNIVGVTNVVVPCVWRESNRIDGSFLSCDELGNSMHTPTAVKITSNRVCARQCNDAKV